MFSTIVLLRCFRQQIVWSCEIRREIVMLGKPNVVPN